MDFGQKPLDASPNELFRFTHEVKEDIQVRSPDIAGAYLLSHVYTPFEAFDQEVGRRNRSNHRDTYHDTRVG